MGARYRRMETGGRPLATGHAKDHQAVEQRSIPLITRSNQDGEGCGGLGPTRCEVE